MEIAKFEFSGTTIPIILTLKEVYEIRSKFDFNVLRLFIEDENAAQQIQRLALDDEFAIDLCWHMIESKVSYGKDKFIENMTDMTVMDAFREAFWAAVVNFSSPLKKSALIQFWRELKKEIKNVDVAKLMSGTSSTDSRAGE